MYYYCCSDIKSKLLPHFSNQSILKSVYFGVLYLWRWHKDYPALRNLWLRKYVPKYAAVGISKAYMKNTDNVKYVADSIVATNCAKKAGLNFYTFLQRCDLDNLSQICEKVLKSNIEGNFLEAGVWRGGSCILMKSILKKYNSSKKLYLLDSFDSMNNFKSEGDESKLDVNINIIDNKQENINTVAGKDIHHHGDSLTLQQVGTTIDEITIELFNDISFYYKTEYSGENYHCVNGVTMQQVRLNFEKFNLWEENKIKLIKGWIDDNHMKEFVNNYLSKNENFALIRMDLDLYHPTKYVLKYLYDRLSIGGYIIFDEYFVPVFGEKSAVDEFRTMFNVQEKILRAGDVQTQRIGYWQKKYHVDN